MILRAFRSLRRIAIGLFLIAQVAGVMPLVSAHSSHDHRGTHVAQHALNNIDGNEIMHRDGQQRSHGVDDECCVLHHGLVGSIPPFFNASVDNPVHVIVGAPVSTLIDGIPLSLDRPPRLLPLI
jgi:hypothetical protein